MSLMTEHIYPILDHRLKAALVAAFLLQTAGALFWAGSAAERISVLERTVANDEATVARVAVLEADMRTVKDSLDRIETKLDRMDERKQFNPLPIPPGRARSCNFRASACGLCRRCMFRDSGRPVATCSSPGSGAPALAAIPGIKLKSRWAKTAKPMRSTC
jgi:hypothetical protein